VPEDFKSFLKAFKAIFNELFDGAKSNPILDGITITRAN